MGIWQLVESGTGRVVGWTDNDFMDLSAEDGLAARLEAAIDDGYLEDGSYEWHKGNCKVGEYI